MQAEHRLNLARYCETDRENGYKNRSSVLSYERSLIRNTLGSRHWRLYGLTDTEDMTIFNSADSL